MSGDGPAGRPVLLLREPGRAAPSIRRLAAAGLRAEARPAIALAAASDPGAARAAVDRLDAYDWCLFTSANGVEWFVRVAGERGAEGGKPPRPRRVAAIGPATARALHEAGLDPDLVAVDSRSEGLAATLLERLRPGQRVLLVRPEVAREVLPRALREAGATVDAIAFYRNVKAPGLDAVVAEMLGGRWRAAVYYAPSNVERVVEAAQRRGARVDRLWRAAPPVAIGEVTADALRRHGAGEVVVAAEPTDEGVLAALATALGRAGREAPPVLPSPLARSRPVISLKQTPIHAAHVAAGARMVDFAGHHLPVQYTGVIDEHLAVRQRAGLFDVSHMGEFRVAGGDALALLQGLTCNDVGRLAPGRAHYTALTTDDGAFVDDLLIYMRGAEEYLLVVNAANRAKDLAWILDHRHDSDAVVEDQSERWAQLALQGPNAAAILDRMLDADLAGLRYYRFIETDVEGAPCIVSRTGYTGEDGFEIYAPAEAGERIWYAVLGAGAPHGCVPVGLGARDTLRLEAKMALYGNDIDETTTVLEADLGWIVKLGKGEFIGRQALVRQHEEGVRRRLVGFRTVGRAVARHGYPVAWNGEVVGAVTSGSYSPTLESNIGLTYLPTAACEPGTEIEIEMRGRREAAVVVQTPFYTRAR